MNVFDVTACLVTRGDQPEMVELIEDSLIFPWMWWDNSKRDDWKCFGRYAMAMEAPTRYVYFQDDDVIVPKETQVALLEEAGAGRVIANYGHGENDGGYGDLPLVCGGAVVDKNECAKAILRYAKHFPLDQDFAYYCDFAIGVLYENFLQLRAPFFINYEVAQHESRLVNQPWAAALKEKITIRGRLIRDNVVQ